MKSAPEPPGNAGRADSGAAEWSGSMVRGFAALEFLERSSDLAAERVEAMPVRAIQAQLARETDSAQPLIVWL